MPGYLRIGVVVLVASLVLVGCSKPDGRYLTNAVDVERAARLWNDPWVAPDTTSAASGRADLFLVDREAASRTYVTPAAPGDAVLAEIQAAQAVGWELTGANCATGANLTGRAEVSLRRSGDLDEAATAWVLAGEASYPAPPQREPSSQDDGSGLSTLGPDTLPVTVRVVVQVPHHLDREWPTPPAVAVEDTCLAGAIPGTSAQVDQYSQPLLAGGRLPGKATKPTHDVPGVPDDLLDALGVVDADPVLAGLGLDLRGPTGTPSNPPGARLPSQTATPTTLAETVGQATSEGWSLTYTGCWASGLTVAELHRDLTGGYSVALRLQQTPDSADDPTQVAFTAAAVVTSPHRGGPGPDDLEPVTTPCWTPPPDTAAPPAFTWAGTPWFGPTTLGTVQP